MRQRYSKMLVSLNDSLLLHSSFCVSDILIVKLRKGQVRSWILQVFFLTRNVLPFLQLIHVFVFYLHGNRNSSLGPMLKRLIKAIFYLFCICIAPSSVLYCIFILFVSFVRVLLKNMRSGIRQRVWHLSMTLTMP